MEGNKERPFETGTLVWYRPVSHDKNRSKPKQGKGVIVPDDQYYEWENNLIHPSGAFGCGNIWRFFLAGFYGSSLLDTFLNEQKKNIKNLSFNLFLKISTTENKAARASSTFGLAHSKKLPLESCCSRKRVSNSAAPRTISISLRVIRNRF